MKTGIQYLSFINNWGTLYFVILILAKGGKLETIFYIVVIPVKTGN